ncbi:hypothetical protein AB5N19_13820 [Seiridium cardinale]
MASPQLAIAKVSFSAVLLRPDPVSCPRAEIDEFLGQLDATLLRCSPANVQKSKQWILNHVVQSTNRVAALGKYLTALAHSFNVDIAATRQAHEPSSKRKRLHILYVLNDLLYHICVRQREDGFSSQLESFLPALAQSAAAFPDCPRHAKKVADLVDLWGEQGYFSKAFIVQLQDAIRDAPTLDPSLVANGSTPRATITGGKISKDAPFIMPAMHGDVTAPWYDLPAANWLPVIEPNSTRPMNPSMIKPLQFMSGPADKSLVEAVQNLLGEVDRIYAKDRCLGDDPAENVDMLGQRVIHDQLTGEVIDGETYYGWSRKFCQKMKQRRKKGNGSEEDALLVLHLKGGEGRIPEARAEAGVGIGLGDEAIAEIEFGDGPTADHAHHLCEETDATHAHGLVRRTTAHLRLHPKTMRDLATITIIQSTQILPLNLRFHLCQLAPTFRSTLVLLHDLPIGKVHGHHRHHLRLQRVQIGCQVYPYRCLLLWILVGARQFLHRCRHRQRHSMTIKVIANSNMAIMAAGEIIEVDEVDIEEVVVAGDRIIVLMQDVINSLLDFRPMNYIDVAHNGAPKYK